MLRINYNPNGRVFGKIGDYAFFNRNVYLKQQFDFKNIGWMNMTGVDPTPTPTATMTPTPTATNVPTPTPTATEIVPTPTPTQGLMLGLNRIKDGMIEQVDQEISSSFDGSIVPNDYTWTGSIDIPSDGLYHFDVDVDDEVDLYINESLIFSASLGQSTYDVSLMSGMQSIRIEYRQTAVTEAYIILRWQPPYEGSLITFGNNEFGTYLYHQA